MEKYMVGPVLNLLIKNLSDYVQDQFRWQTGMKKQLESLQDNYPKIQAVVSTAKRAQTEDQSSPLNKWIWQLRDAIDEADDLLDELEYKKHKKPTIRRNLIKVGKRALKIDPDLKRLEEAVQKLDKVSAKVSDFLHLLKSRKQEQREQQIELHKTRLTGSLPKDVLIGRGKDKEFVIEWLTKPSIEEPQTNVTSTTLYNNISLLSIVGHGGMGKTTLLQHVYQDEITKEFDLKMWVCVSDIFDVNKVISNMLESINHNSPSLESLDALQEILKSKVMSKKFLLVLDDLWDKEEEVVLRGKWGDVLAPLAYGGLGSKILISTRTCSVASMITNVIKRKKEVLRLEGLEEDECLQLLTTHAFDVGENPDDHGNLKSIAVELVKKLYGSPLLAKAMGGVLNSSLDEGHWRNVLNTSLGFNGIFPILKLSYMFLPEHLQSCFSFCSIFEQDHNFDKYDLIRMWIAVGFIQPTDNNQGETLTLDNIGERYFDVLIKKSFFDKVSTNEYKMHDLLHELAQSISTQECFRYVGDEKSLLLKIPKTIRHLFIKTSNLEVVKNVGRFKNLRTLFIICHVEGFVDALNEMFKVTRTIRLLVIDSLIGDITEAIGYLLHLRYVNFCVFYATLLPRSISRLYHLQFLIDDHFWEDNINKDYFPRAMNNLSNLCYLSQRRLNFPGIGKLKFLQELKGFRIKKKNGYRIEELEHMNDLRIVEIYNLKDVKDSQEATNAKLYDKRKLTELYLNWGDGSFPETVCNIVYPGIDERVLDNLQPHNHLKKLSIYNYMGVRSAKWMNEARLINYLQEINLFICLEWEILPPFGQLPFLKTLCLHNLPKVKQLENKFRGNDMCCAFPSLEKLTLRNLEALVDWFDASVVDGLFPCLTTLELFQCPNLLELHYLPPKLETLRMSNIGWKTLNCCTISNSIPLKTLWLEDMPKVKRLENKFHGNDMCCSFPSLEKLTLLNLEALVDWFDASVVDRLFPCLTELRLDHCPNLLELPYLPPKVETLYMYNVGWKTLNFCTISKSIPLKILYVLDCPNITSISPSCEIGKLRQLTVQNLPSLQSLPISLTNASSLQILKVEKLPLLRELPDLPPSLKRLYINECDPELMKCHEEFSNLLCLASSTP